MPTVADLHQARAFMSKQRQDGSHGAVGPSGEEDSESEDDEVGPQLCDPRTARLLQAQAAAQPLGFAGKEVGAEFERAFAYDILGRLLFDCWECDGPCHSQLLAVWRFVDCGG
jgi:hypothetical protein